MTLEKIKRAAVRDAWTRHADSTVAAARELDVSVRYVQLKLAELGLSQPRGVRADRRVR
jgi:transcriptional regulator with PAS, ATPase and Fis domain